MYAESLKTEYVIDLTSPAKDKNDLYLRRGITCSFFQFQMCEFYQLETKTASNWITDENWCHPFGNHVDFYGYGRGPTFLTPGWHDRHFLLLIYRDWSFDSIISFWSLKLHSISALKVIVEFSRWLFPVSNRNWDILNLDLLSFWASELFLYYLLLLGSIFKQRRRSPPQADKWLINPLFSLSQVILVDRKLLVSKWICIQARESLNWLTSGLNTVCN